MNPAPPGHRADSAETFAACRELIRHGSHSFHLASLLLPREVAVPAIALYAFCRVADDLIDADEGGSDAVDGLRVRLDAIYARRPGAAVEDRALAEVVERFALPRSMPDALLEGLAWDAAGRDYETLSELYDYAARVAGCVGAMMTLVMRTTDARAIARACDLGVAMQLTNIARDVGEDARMGRLYLPRAWFREAGIDPEGWLANPVEDARIAAMTRRLLGYADILYRRSDAGIRLLPFACRPGIRAARLMYAGIGREVAALGYRNIATRAIVPYRRKLGLLARAALGTPFGNAERDADALAWPPLTETRYLLADVESVPFQPRVEWLVDLFDSLEKRRHAR